MQKLLIGLLAILLIITFCSKDEDDNKVESVTIGNQVWMKKNLDVDHYRNGDSIPQVTDSAEWTSLRTGAWCYYNNDPDSGAIYGKLYNRYAVTDPRGLAPEGWHTPNKEEFDTLLANWSDVYVAYEEMINGGASGFGALLGGYRHHYGSFRLIGSWANFWSTTSYSDGISWLLILYSDDRYAYLFHYGDCRFGLSVRCVKD